MRARDSQAFTGISADTANFKLDGGLYAIDVVSAHFGLGAVELQKLGADGSSYVSVGTDFTANGYASAQLPAGLYKLAVTGVTAYVAIARIPGE
jgi:hypothetical protein